ncbi:XRE family transcriptional regulator [Corallococcus sp. CA054B]|nr:XRE family transcriptional regulator [Corallococcus sp. CA054B]
MGETFGEMMRTQRLKTGKTMGDLARYLGVSVTYVSDVERGTRAPLTPEKILKVANYLDVDSKPLLASAALSRGAFELNVNVATSAKAMEVGALLMRGWSDLSDDELGDIQKIIRRKEKSK